MSEARTVVVTGASRGLGLGICTALLREGYRVVAVSRSTTPEFEALRAEQGEAVAFVPFDLSETHLIHEFCRGVLTEHGTPYGLVNNAAIGTDGVLSTLHESDIARLIATNLTAPIVLTKYLSRAMLSKREGRIVNISSIIAGTGYSGLSVYGATKAGLEGFTRSLSRELGKRSITVNNVAPGYMETDMTTGLGAAGLESVRRRAPLGLASPADVAPAVVYLLGAGAALVTGSTLTVDGGSTA